MDYGWWTSWLFLHMGSNTSGIKRYQTMYIKINNNVNCCNIFEIFINIIKFCCPFNGRSTIIVQN